MARTRAGKAVLKDTLITFGSVEEMVEYSASASAEVLYRVNGFYEAGDGGDGFFHWQSSYNQALADGGTIIDPDNIDGWDGSAGDIATFITAQGAGSGSGCWVRDYSSLLHPQWFGAIVDVSIDSSAPLQRALDVFKASYVNGIDGFTLILDFKGGIFRNAEPLDFTMLRQPGATIQNGGLHGACSGKTVIDFAGTNTLTVKDFLIYGDKDASPQVGFYVGRSNDLLHSAGHRFINVFVNGYFTRACAVNLASEVFQSISCRYRNMNRKLTSYAFVSAGHAGTLDTYIGGLTSEFVTLPVAADGEMSNILHYHQQAHFQRAADVSIPIISISNTNAALVSVDPTALLNSDLANGDKVFLNNVTGMTEVNHQTYTVANINTTAGTFNLSGIDATAYGVFVSGGLFNQTGPALLLGGVHGMYCDASYLLAQGSSSIIVDMETGLPIRDCRFSFHSEPHPFNIIDFRRTTLTESVINGLEVNLLNTYQTIDKDALRITGGGTIKINDLRLKLAYLANVPQNGLLFPAGGFRLHNANISTPLAASLNAVEDFIDFSGTVASSDDNKLTMMPEVLSFAPNAVALTAPGLRFSADTLYCYREQMPSERRVSVQDNDITTQFTDAGSRINTYDKYTGKRAFNVSTLKTLTAAGGGTTDVWVSSDGATIHTPS